ncbi:MAG TPA: hypothetical protein DEB25_06290 [Desulfobulbaceae bacterium]|nr:hypothetical protein [Desulfobulbaceae bacterium]
MESVYVGNLQADFINPIQSEGVSKPSSREKNLHPPKVDKGLPKKSSLIRRVALKNRYPLSEGGDQIDR